MSARRDSSFSNFLVDDGNRRAHDLCIAVSDAQPISPLPLLLVGEPGSGKSHLLFSIANRLRATAGHASILFVSPGAWGAEIDRIIADPSPIDMARQAVLLVDDLHALSARHEPLARLIEIFLENDHPVVMATEVHPDRLGVLPVKLRRQIKGGQAAEIRPHDARRSLEAVEARLREEQREAIAKMEQRLRELEAETPEAAAARKQSRAAELEQTRREADEARAELETLRAELALLKVSAREGAQARARVKELEQQLLDRAKQPAPEAEVEAEPLKRKLNEARFDAQKAREEARGMLERAQQLVVSLQHSRETFQEAKRERDRQREEIQKLSAVFDGQSEGEEGTRGEGQEASGEADGAQVSVVAESQHVAPQPDTSALQDEIHRLQESLVRARSERDTLKSHLAHIRDELDETRADLERVRVGASQERADHEQQAREVQEALVARHAELESLRAAHQTLTEEAEGLRAQVAEGAAAMERLMGLLGAARESVAPSTPDGGGSLDAAAETGLQASSGETAGGDARSDEPPVIRADFGEGLRLGQKRTPGVHHVEELRNAAGGLPPLDSDDDEFFRDARTA